MRGEILSVGTELLLGEIVDTNAAWLATRLAELGVDCHWISQVGDNPGRIARLLELAWGRSELIVTSGGLGPTDDDVTREAVAAFLGEPLEVDAAELERQRALRRRLGLPAGNDRQARRIPSARFLPNPAGSAPGWWVEREGHLLVLLPGVPREMRAMWEQEVAPALAGRSGAVLRRRRLKLVGIGESAVAERLADLTPAANPSVATYAKAGGVEVRVAVKGPAGEAEERLREVEAEIRRRLGEYVWGADEERLEDVVAARLAAAPGDLGLGEAGTRGLLAATLAPLLPEVRLRAVEIRPAPAGDPRAEVERLAADLRRRAPGARLLLAALAREARTAPVPLGEVAAVALLDPEDEELAREAVRTVRPFSTAGPEQGAVLAALDLARRRLPAP
ncbi:MAG: competence/damage-inducible protein A [Firmicutes bacterium]|nr:competence/damage-inducible protein A [Bacillota bacterium]